MPSVRAALARGSLACIGAAALLSSTPAPHNTARVCAQSTAVASLRALLLGSPSTARGASLSRCSLSFDRFVVGAKLRGVASAELSVAAAGWARARWLRESARRQRNVSARVTLCCDALARRAAGAARRGVAAREPPLLRRANKNRRASPAAALRRRRRRRAGSRVWRERTEAVANAFGRACVCALGGRAWRALLRARRELCFVAEAEFAFFLFFLFSLARQPSRKSFRTKRILATKMKSNKPLPQWIRYRTGASRVLCVRFVWFVCALCASLTSTHSLTCAGNTIRYNAKRRNWRRTKLGI